jgi:hypothetical protein
VPAKDGWAGAGSLAARLTNRGEYELPRGASVEPWEPCTGSRRGARRTPGDRRCSWTRTATVAKPGRRAALEIKVAKIPGVAAVREVDASADPISECFAGGPLTATATAPIARTASAAPAIARLGGLLTRVLSARRPLDPRKRTLRTRRPKAPTRRPRTRRGATPPSASRLALPAARVRVLGTCGTALACSSNQRSSPSLSPDPVLGSPDSGRVGRGAEDRLRSSSRYGSGGSVAAGLAGSFSTSWLAGTISEDAKSLTARRIERVRRDIRGRLRILLLLGLAGGAAVLSPLGAASRSVDHGPVRVVGGSWRRHPSAVAYITWRYTR